jgi:hypothetical protein
MMNNEPGLIADRNKKLTMMVGNEITCFCYDGRRKQSKLSPWLGWTNTWLGLR